MQVFANNVFNIALSTSPTSRKQWLQELVNTYSDGVTKDFANRVGIDPTGLYLYLGGKREVSDRTVIKVCNKLSIMPPEGMLASAIQSKTPPPPEPSEAERVDRVEAAIERLNKAMDEQSVLLRTLAELLLARKSG